MTKKHLKNGPLLMHFYAPVEAGDVDTAFNSFDDRTLASLVGSADGGRPALPCDGRDEDEPYKTLPLQRWQDRTRRGGSR